MVRCLLALAAVAPTAVAINNRLLASEGDAIQQGMELSVQTRQYAMLFSHEERAEVAGPNPSTLLAELMNAGEAASLNEAGYSAVAGLRSQEAMQAFAERLLAEDGLQVKDKAMLGRVMPFYNGECAQQSFTALRTQLHQATSPQGCHAAWVEKAESSATRPLSLLAGEPHAAVHPQFGDVAPLDETGYLAVVALKSNDEMKTFIRRISKSQGLEVGNEGGLSGFAKYYSGVCATQSFASLVKELRSVQHAMRTTSVSYELLSDEPVDAQKISQRIVAATGLKPDQIDVSIGKSMPDAAQLKKALASKVGVAEDRVTMMKHTVQHVESESRAKSGVVPKAVEVHTVEHVDSESLAKSGAEVVSKASEIHHTSALMARAPSSKVVESVVVTITSAMDEASVEDILKSLPGRTSMALKVNREPVTMVASVAQPQSCGGGWVAPIVSQ